MMKPLFIVQYYPYQYNQFKLLADKLGVDIYYKSNLTEFTEDKRKTNQDIYYNGRTHESFTLQDLSSMYFDYVIYTGPCKTYINKVQNITRYKFTIYLAHSLMGTRYDCEMGMPYTTRSIGIMPALWKTFESYQKVTELIHKDNCEFEQFTSRSNPIVAEALSLPPKLEVEKGTIGLVLGELSPFEQGRDICLRNLKRLNCNKIKVKFHPLTRQEDKELFMNNPKFEILDINSYKYDFTDSCEYIVGGASSLLLEAIMRAKYFRRNQKFAKLKIRRGIDINLPQLSEITPEWSLQDFKLYDDMIMTPEGVIREHLDLIERATEYMILNYKDEHTSTGYRTRLLSHHDERLDYKLI